MQPLQVWLPEFGASLTGKSARDAERAFQAWDGDQTVWLLPWLEKPARWRATAKALPTCAIPAETFDALYIYHVDRTGSVLGAGAGSRFPSGRVDGLLDAWLNVPSRGGVLLLRPERAMRLSAPRVRAGQIVMEAGTAVFEDVTVRLAPGPMLPITAVDAGERTVEVTWPPPGCPSPISFEAESHERVGPLIVTADGIAGSMGDPRHRALHVECVWPEPLRRLFPTTGCGWDALFAPAQMAVIASASRNDAAMGALKARTAAGPYVAEGDTTIELLDFLHALARGPDAAWGAAEGLKLLDKAPDAVACRDLRAAYFSGGWQEILKRRVPVRRCWGPIGLGWALLIEQFERKDRPRVCGRCSRIITGSTAKQFCGPADNVDCFRGRRAALRKAELERQRRETAGGPKDNLPPVE